MNDVEPTGKGRAATATPMIGNASASNRLSTSSRPAEEHAGRADEDVRMGAPEEEKRQDHEQNVCRRHLPAQLAEDRADDERPLGTRRNIRSRSADRQHGGSARPGIPRAGARKGFPMDTSRSRCMRHQAGGGHGRRPSLGGELSSLRADSSVCARAYAGQSAPAPCRDRLREPGPPNHDAQATGRAYPAAYRRARSRGHDAPLT